MRKLLRRFVPSTMGARLVLTAAVIAATTTIVTLGINTVLMNAQADAWTRDEVVVVLEGFHEFLAQEGRDVAADVRRLTEAPSLRKLFASGDGPALQEQHGSRLISRDATSTTVGLDPTGRVLFSDGADVDISRLQALALAHSSEETTGMISVSGGVAFVYGRPVMAVDGSRPVGYVITARLASAERLQGIDPYAGRITARFHEAGYRPSGITLRRGSANGAPVEFGTDDTATVVLAEVPAIDGGFAGTVVLRDLDPRGGRSSVAVESSVLAGIAAGLIGLGLGLWLAGIMRRPVGRMISHTRRRAQLAATGAEVGEGAFAQDIGLPEEFQELEAVINDLVRHLGERRAQLEQAVRDAEYAEEALGTVVDEANEAKIVIQDGVVAIANPAALKALGTTRDDLVGHSPTKSLGAIDIRTEDDTVISGPELIDRALEDRLTVSVTLRDGTQRWYEIEAVRRTDHHHDRMLVTARDITEERRVATIRAEIISLVGHDLRSPLTVVIGYLDLLQQPMKDEDRVRALDAARRNAARMADLLEDLLSATRAEELLAPSDLVPTSLTMLAEEVVSSLGPTHSERPLLLESDCDPIVLGEEKRLRQVLVNLVTNAYKYSPDPEPIVVRVRCDEKTAYLEVIDHGPGIPADERDHVFERFARLHGGESRAGIGLGLYIVSIIAHNHGGSVHVEETPGGGATFTVELPLVGTMIDGEFVL